MKLPILALSLALATAGCRSTPPAAAESQATGSFTSDSARARELREFRGASVETAELSHGATSLEALAREIVTAMVAGDTARLQQLALSRDEFGWIYYPSSPQGKPPYDLDPATMWMMLSNQGSKGLGHAIERLQGKAVAFGGVSCDEKVSVEGENRLYGPCLVSVTGSKELAGTGRLFGLVIERHGQWKVVNYANQLD